MKERIFSMRRKLGFAPRPLAGAGDQAKLRSHVEDAVRMTRLLEDKNWPVMQGVFDSLRTEAVTKLEQRNAKVEESNWAKSRLENLRAIQEEIRNVIKKGESANQALEALKESKK